MCCQVSFRVQQKHHATWNWALNVDVRTLHEGLSEVNLGVCVCVSHQNCCGGSGKG